MAPVDTSSPIEYLAGLVPYPAPSKTSFVVGTILLIITICILRLASPGRCTQCMDEELEKATTLYEKAVHDQLLDFQIKDDRTIAEGLSALDDEARELRIKTLGFETGIPPLLWWNVLVALFTGHSVAIAKCTWNIRDWRRRIQFRSSLYDAAASVFQQLIMEHRARDFSMAATPAQQLRLRRHCRRHGFPDYCA
ncbi:hypothetical protein GGX14DRAFT_559497 [Mycena pura]|uniref:Uncharacterized protein n=1 Tax=Mycena pura TaxID=153505 RepID=A0AAD6VRM5_9AGAR|nr:hypothetical protein GGX14DRAFT_559497 [Mycena pura]